MMSVWVPAPPGKAVWIWTFFIAYFAQGRGFDMNPICLYITAHYQSRASCPPVDIWPWDGCRLHDSLAGGRPACACNAGAVGLDACNPNAASTASPGMERCV